jgi:ADP-heptose:LPS heptosyltransferase
MQPSFLLPSGLGDIHWCLLRLQPAFSDLHITIAHTTVSPEAHRSVSWLTDCYPCVSKVSTQLVNTEAYNELLSHWQLPNLKQYPTLRHPYAVNLPLERGVKLAEIDDHEVNWDIEVTTKNVPLPYHKYIALYVSRAAPWKAAQWAELANSTNLPVLLLGANWDHHEIKAVTEHLRNSYCVWLGRPPQEVLWGLQNASLFIGYQSGLNILADRLRTKQVMIYFMHLRKMIGTWNDPRYLDLHKDFCFFDPWEEILNSVKCN